VKLFKVANFPRATSELNIWILYLIATFNIESMTNYFVGDIVPYIFRLKHCSDFEEYICNPFFSIADYIVNRLKDHMNQIFDTWPILIELTEKKCIRDRFMKQLDVEYLRNNKVGSCIFSKVVQKSSNTFKYFLYNYINSNEDE
jgi:hypothetical protein